MLHGRRVQHERMHGPRPAVVLARNHPSTTRGDYARMEQYGRDARRRRTLRRSGGEGAPPSIRGIAAESDGASTHQRNHGSTKVPPSDEMRVQAYYSHWQLCHETARVLRNRAASISRATGVRRRIRD